MEIYRARARAKNFFLKNNLGPGAGIRTYIKNKNI